jgi:hypothetical protein
MTTPICTECTGTWHGHYSTCSQYGGDKRHVHHKEIHAYAEGEDIQYFNDIDKKWYDIEKPDFVISLKYRVKPNLEKTLDSLLGDLVVAVVHDVTKGLGATKGAGATIVNMKLRAIKAFFKEHTK